LFVSLYVLSDLHIKGADDPLYAELVAFLKSRPRPGDTVVLAGDLFDLFVGGKRVFLERYRAFLEALFGAGSRGVEIHYIEGNHDFQLKRAFSQIPNFTLHQDSVSLEVGDKRVYCCHGDTVDRRDLRYLALRMAFRSPFMKAFVGAVPGEWIDGIGRVSSRLSRSRKPALPVELPRVGMEELRKVYRNFAAEKLAEGYDFVVMGHCHDLDEMCFIVEGREGQYINVGYPPVHGSILSWSPGEDKIRRERFAGASDGAPR
jgi:UDP-2,3-diacylglucosamine hydrolase